MPEPLAYLITWTTHGTWLPGDERGWVQWGVEGVQAGDAARRRKAERRQYEPAIVLNSEQRALVEATVRAHCEIRRWSLHAVNARSNHVHVVVTADAEPAKVMDQFKAWSSRRLNEWTEQAPRNAGGRDTAAQNGSMMKGICKTRFGTFWKGSESRYQPRAQAMLLSKKARCARGW